MTERIDQLSRDLENQAKTLSVIVTDQREMRDQLVGIDKLGAVRAEHDKHVDSRFDRIEASLQSVFTLGKWILAAIGSSLLVALVGFVVRGGLLGP